MKLLYTPTSPYVRKVRILAAERGVPLEVQPVDPHGDDPALLAASPAGKVPVLVLDHQTSIQDSRVICDYLEAQAGAAPVSVEIQAREALAEAILDAAVVVVLERRRPEGERSASAQARQFARIRRIADAFNAKLPPPATGPLTREQIGVAVGLAYLDFRLPDVAWRDGRPQLTEWFASLETRPSMVATQPPAA